ncbi:MAG: tRNA (N6-isopentenyl adenosine(37)-C2)-methylthiotransferase MiaB [Myxococcota bacterium]
MTRLPILQPEDPPFEDGRHDSPPGKRSAQGGAADRRAAGDFTSPITAKVWIDTYGCQMNAHDSARMLGLMAEDGYTQTLDPDQADLLIINSCSVREKAEHKLRSAAGKLKNVKKKNPAAVIALAGCVAQQEGQALLDRIAHADLVVGPDHLVRLPELVARVRHERVRLNETLFVERQDYVFPRLSFGAQADVSSYVSIMKGCDKFCSFCVVPMTRGREVCRDADEIVAEVRHLAERGTREIILLGQTVNTYGARSVHGEIPFRKLLERVAEVEGVERIRFTSPHPADFTEEQILAFRDIEKLCPHMHLPVQSGSSSVLKAMRRGYTRERYLEIVDRFREVAPEASLTTDIIVGFPGETLEDFEETLSLMRYVRYDGAFSFAYSERTGTRAVEVEEGVVDPEERRRRLFVLQQLQDEHTKERLSAMVGRTYPVLFEGPSKSDPTKSSGRTGQNRVVHVDGQVGRGVARMVEIREAYAHSLYGVLPA